MIALFVLLTLVSGSSDLNNYSRINKSIQPQPHSTLINFEKNPPSHSYFSYGKLLRLKRSRDRVKVNFFPNDGLNIERRGGAQRRLRLGRRGARDSVIREADFRTSVNGSAVFLDSNSTDQTRSKSVMVVLIAVSVLFCLSLFELLRIKLNNKVESESGDSTFFLMGKQFLTMDNTNILAKRKKYLLTYLGQIIPAVFLGGDMFPPYSDIHWRGPTLELCQHYRYAALVLPSSLSRAGGGRDGGAPPSPRRQREARLRSLLQLLSAQSILLFFALAMYNHQYPADDGSCASYGTPAVCAGHLRSYGDTDHSRCGWAATPGGDPDQPSSAEGGAESGRCFFRPQYFTIEVFFIISMLLSLIAAPLNACLDFLFNDVLLAEGLGPERSEPDKRVLAPPVLKRCRRRDAPLAVPCSGHTARKLVSECLGDSFQLAMSQLEAAASDRQSAHMDAMNCREKWEMFVQCFKSQLDDLKDSLRTKFAKDWGWSIQTSAFRENATPYKLCWTPFRTKSYTAFLTEEIERSDQSYREHCDRLREATDVEIGAEVIHQFLVDLLGQTSVPASILICKIERDFKRPAIASPLTKRLTCVLILLLEVVFITVAISLSLRQSAEFQKQFLAVSLGHFVLNVAVFEVIECLMLQYVIPKLVSAEVNAALAILVRTVESSLSLSTYYSVSAEYGYVNMTKSRKHVAPYFNSPDYFFPSRRLAGNFSHLFESFIVAVFISIQPSGEIRKINQSESHLSWHTVLRMSNALSIFNITLRKLGTCPVLVQQIVVYVIQSIILYAIYYILVLLSENPLFLILPIMSLSYEVLCHLLLAPLDRKATSIVPEIFSPPPSGALPSSSVQVQEERNNFTTTMNVIKPEVTVALSETDTTVAYVKTFYNSSRSDDVEDDVSNDELRIAEGVKKEKKDSRLKIITEERERAELAAVARREREEKRLEEHIKAGRIKVEERLQREKIEEEAAVFVGTEETATILEHLRDKDRQNPHREPEREESFWKVLGERLQKKKVLEKILLVRATQSDHSDPWQAVRVEMRRIQEEEKREKEEVESNEKKKRVVDKFHSLYSMVDEVLQAKADAEREEELLREERKRVSANVFRSSIDQVTSPSKLVRAVREEYQIEERVKLLREVVGLEVDEEDSDFKQLISLLMTTQGLTYDLAKMQAKAFIIRSVHKAQSELIPPLTHTPEKSDGQRFSEYNATIPDGERKSDEEDELSDIDYELYNMHPDTFHQQISNLMSAKITVNSSPGNYYKGNATANDDTNNFSLKLELDGVVRDFKLDDYDES